MKTKNKKTKEQVINQPENQVISPSNNQQTSQVKLPKEQRIRMNIELKWLYELIDYIDNAISEYYNYYTDLIRTIDKQIKEIDKMFAITYNKYLIANNQTEWLIDVSKFEIDKVVKMINWYETEYNIEQATRELKKPFNINFHNYFKNEILSKLGEIDLYNQKLEDFILSPYKYLPTNFFDFSFLNEKGMLEFFEIDINVMEIILLNELKTSIIIPDYQIIKEYLELTELEKRRAIINGSFIIDCICEILNLDLYEYFTNKATEQAENEKAILEATQPKKQATEQATEPKKYSFGEFKENGKFLWTYTIANLCCIVNDVCKKLYFDIRKKKLTISYKQIAETIYKNFEFKTETNIDSLRTTLTNYYEASPTNMKKSEIEQATKIIEQFFK